MDKLRNLEILLHLLYYSNRINRFQNCVFIVFAKLLQHNVVGLKIQRSIRCL